METINLTILKATSGHKLVNREQQVIAVEVQLAPKASASDWEEITDEEAEALQKEWESKHEEPTEENTTETTETAE